MIESKPRLIGLALLFSTLVVPSFGFSSQSTFDLQVKIFKAIDEEAGLPEKGQRLRFARAIEAYWKAVENVIPKLSPRERSWLEGEMEGDIARELAAQSRPEYGLWYVERVLAVCLRSSAGLVESLSEGGPNEEYEMIHWLGLLNCYSDPEDVYDMLAQGGVAVVSIPYGTADGRLSFNVGIAKAARDRIVNFALPAAISDIMGWRDSR